MATPFATGTPSDAGSEDTSDLQNQWNTFLDKPEGRAALLSFGINMLQPPSFGDNPLAQAGRAIGAAGQTGANIEAMNLKQEEAKSKEELRASQASAAEARAGATGSAAQTAQARLGLAQLGLQLQSAKALHGAYNTYRGAWQKQKDAALLDPKMDPGPLKSLDEFTAANPSLAALAQHSGLFGGGSGGGAPAAPNVGDVRGGYRFIGGDPGSPASWESVGG